MLCSSDDEKSLKIDAYGQATKKFNETAPQYVGGHPIVFVHLCPISSRSVPKTRKKTVTTTRDKTTSLHGWLDTNEGHAGDPFWALEIHFADVVKWRKKKRENRETMIRGHYKPGKVCWRQRTLDTKQVFYNLRINY